MVEGLALRCIGLGGGWSLGIRLGHCVLRLGFGDSGSWIGVSGIGIGALRIQV